MAFLQNLLSVNRAIGRFLYSDVLIYYLHQLLKKPLVAWLKIRVSELVTSEHLWYSIQKPVPGNGSGQPFQKPVPDNNFKNLF